MLKWTLFFLISGVEAQAGVLSYGFSGSSGTMAYVGEESIKYSEAEFQLQYHIDDTFSLSASGFARFVEDEEKLYGTYFSAPISLDLGFEALGIRPFVAPGYRVLGRYHSPYISGGLSFKFLIAKAGVGYRTVFNELVKNGLQDESQIYLFFTAGVF